MAKNKWSGQWKIKVTLSHTIKTKRNAITLWWTKGWMNLIYYASYDILSSSHPLAGKSSLLMFKTNAVYPVHQSFLSNFCCWWTKCPLWWTHDPGLFWASIPCWNNTSPGSGKMFSCPMFTCVSHVFYLVFFRILELRQLKVTWCLDIECTSLKYFCPFEL